MDLGKHTIGTLRRRPEARSWSRLHQPERMHELLEQERARSQRSGQEFSLVIFRVRAGVHPSLTTLRLARTVLSRARHIDEVGWLDERRLCALLPYTSGQGAWKFAEGICSRLAKKSPRPQCMVYTYPSQWFKRHTAADHAHHHDGNGHGNGNGHDKTSTTNGKSAKWGDFQPHRPKTTPQDSQEFHEPPPPGLGHDAVPAAPMDSFFVRPMPRWKRAIDVCGAAVGLAAISPLFLLIAAGIKLTSPGPVLFRQRRMGRGGHPFLMVKFRTMVADADARKASLRTLSEQDGPAFKLTDDPRITPFGRILRCTSLDELPQLWNVLRGEMSLVGPRPLPMEEAEECEAWHCRRLDVTPGLTCVWQINGRSRVTFAEWMRMDVQYIRQRTFLNDLKILLMTIPAVLKRKGAH